MPDPGVPLLPKLWLILVCGLVCAALIRRGLGLFEAAIVTLTVLSALCLVLSGCAPITQRFADSPQPSDQWQRHNGYPVRWDRDAAPLLLVISEETVYWVHHIQESAQRWNDALGFDLYRVSPDLVPDTMAQALEANDAGIVPVLTSTQGRAFTRFGLIPNGRFVSCAIVLPDDLDTALYPSARNVVTHEMGHAAGLGHDDDISSVMYPTLRLPPRFPPEIQDVDVRALRSWYGETE